MGLFGVLSTMLVLSSISLICKPALAARAAFYLQSKRYRFLGGVCRLVYILVFHVRRFISNPPTTGYDKLATVLWISRNATKSVQTHLQAQMSTTVVWNSETEPVLVEINRAVFGDGNVSDKGKGNINWVRLGFQGLDPSTDFRSTGVLGLRTCHFFYTSTKDAARFVQESGSSEKLSNAAAPWYPISLVLIRLTMAVATAVTRDVNLINLTKEDEEWFFKFIVYLLHDFHSKWSLAVARGSVRTVMGVESVVCACEANLYQTLGEYLDSRE